MFGKCEIYVSQNIPKFSVDQKGLAAMLTSVWLAGVALKVNLRIMQVSNRARDPSWL